jgi:hypothetical protein
MGWKYDREELYEWILMHCTILSFQTRCHSATSHSFHELNAIYCTSNKFRSLTASSYEHHADFPSPSYVPLPLTLAKCKQNPDNPFPYHTKASGDFPVPDPHQAPSLCKCNNQSRFRNPHSHRMDALLLFRSGCSQTNEKRHEDEYVCTALFCIMY